MRTRTRDEPAFHPPAEIYKKPVLVACISEATAAGEDPLKYGVTNCKEHQNDEQHAETNYLSAGRKKEPDAPKSLF
jgi:hypothetical protein